MIAEIRAKLRSGESISAICEEYDVSLADLVGMMRYRDPPERPKKPKELLYITKRDGHYFLRKGNVYYGSYRTIEDAKKVRDYFMLRRWDKRKIDEACEKVGVERIKQGRY